MSDKKLRYFFGKEKLYFWIDEILVRKCPEKGTQEFSIKIIPDIESRYFPPYHTRFINVHPGLLAVEMYTALVGNDVTQNVNFTGKMQQGGKYSIDVASAPSNLFEDDFELTADHSPFLSFEERSQDDLLFMTQDGIRKLDVNELSITTPPNASGSAFIYCFNVGQGDSLLLITSENNAYLIDTNIYNDDDCKILKTKSTPYLRSMA